MIKKVCWQMRLQHAHSRRLLQQITQYFRIHLTNNLSCGHNRGLKPLCELLDFKVYCYYGTPSTSPPVSPSFAAASQRHNRPLSGVDAHAVFLSGRVYLHDPYRAHLAVAPLDRIDGALRAVGCLPYHELANAVTTMAPLVQRTPFGTCGSSHYGDAHGHVWLSVLYPVQ